MKFCNEKHTINWVVRNDFKIGTTVSNELISTIIGGMLSNIPLPVNIVLEENGDEYKVLSGEQYIKAIKSFFKTKVSLVETDFLKDLGMKPINVDGLDDDTLDELLDTEINFSVLRPLSSNDRKLVNSFISVLNNNVALEKITEQVSTTNVNPENKSIAKPVIKEEAPEFVKEADIDKVLTGYVGHEFFKKVNIKDVDRYILLQLLFVDFEGVPRDMNSKNLDKFRDTLNAVPNITAELDYLNLAFPESEALLKKVHLPIIFLCSKTALKNNVTPSKFKDLILEFLNSDNEVYKNAHLKGGVANKCNVNARISEMTRWFENKIK